MTQQTNYGRRLNAKKSVNTLQLLFRAARLTNEWAVARSRRESDRPNLRTSHTTLFPHIDLEGTRITALAQRVGISKQAVSELVDELEEMGTVQRKPDPSDGRAKLVTFTVEGKNGIFAGLELLGRLEGELAEEIGARRMLHLRKSLSKIIEEMEKKSLLEESQ